MAAAVLGPAYRNALHSAWILCQDLFADPLSQQQAQLAKLIDYWPAPERQKPEETQLDRIEAKLDRIIKRLAA